MKGSCVLREDRSTTGEVHCANVPHYSRPQPPPLLRQQGGGHLDCHSLSCSNEDSCQTSFSVLVKPDVPLQMQMFQLY